MLLVSEHLYLNLSRICYVSFLISSLCFLFKYIFAKNQPLMTHHLLLKKLLKLRGILTRSLAYFLKITIIVYFMDDLGHNRSFKPWKNLWINKEEYKNMGIVKLEHIDFNNYLQRKNFKNSYKYCSIISSFKKKEIFFLHCVCETINEVYSLVCSHPNNLKHPNAKYFFYLLYTKKEMYCWFFT